MEPPQVTNRRLIAAESLSKTDYQNINFLDLPVEA